MGEEREDTGANAQFSMINSQFSINDQFLNFQTLDIWSLKIYCKLKIDN